MAKSFDLQLREYASSVSHAKIAKSSKSLLNLYKKENQYDNRMPWKLIQFHTLWWYCCDVFHFVFVEEYIRKWGKNDMPWDNEVSGRILRIITRTHKFKTGIEQKKLTETIVHCFCNFSWWQVTIKINVLLHKTFSNNAQFSQFPKLDFWQRVHQVEHTHTSFETLRCVWGTEVLFSYQSYCTIDDRVDGANNLRAGTSMSYSAHSGRHGPMFFKLSHQSSNPTQYQYHSYSFLFPWRTDRDIDSHNFPSTNKDIILTMPLTPQQVAGHLGVSNNPAVSNSAQHASRQTVLGSTSSASRPSLAGTIGVASNPNVSKGTQYQARVLVMKSTGGGGRKK